MKWTTFSAISKDSLKIEHFSKTQTYLQECILQCIGWLWWPSATVGYQLTKSLIGNSECHPHEHQQFHRRVLEKSNHKQLEGLDRINHGNEREIYSGRTANSVGHDSYQRALPVYCTSFLHRQHSALQNDRSQRRSEFGSGKLSAVSARSLSLHPPRRLKPIPMPNRRPIPCGDPSKMMSRVQDPKSARSLGLQSRLSTGSMPRTSALAKLTLVRSNGRRHIHFTFS